jgi:hypothetical protein
MCDPGRASVKGEGAETEADGCTECSIGRYTSVKGQKFQCDFYYYYYYYCFVLQLVNLYMFFYFYLKMTNVVNFSLWIVMMMMTTTCFLKIEVDVALYKIWIFQSVVSF